MNKRERKPNQLLNDIIVFPRRSCEHKELQESTPNDSLDFKPYYKLELSKKFATTYDKDDGGLNKGIFTFQAYFWML